jgi:LDH2 family malate/lactate/ureidoglycolate dehydrogenase
LIADAYHLFELDEVPMRSLSDSEEKPGALFGNPPGAMLPLGGIDLGHKGFALGLMVEVLTAGLCGTG